MVLSPHVEENDHAVDRTYQEDEPILGHDRIRLEAE